MPRFTPKVVTANTLRSGEVVYLAADGTWTPCHENAELIADEAMAEARLAAASAQGTVVVGPYLADATPGAAGPQPVHIREAFRTRGPSNYHHGKQEAAHA